jgi:hypothetical protein
MTEPADDPSLTTQDADSLVWPEIPALWESLQEFHDRLDWTEPWARELATCSGRFDVVATAIAATLVSIELVMVLSRSSTIWFATVILDGRVVGSPASMRPADDRSHEWTAERHRLAEEAVFDVWRASWEVYDHIERALAKLRSEPPLLPERRPIVRAMVAAKSSIHMLSESIWDTFGYKTATAWRSRPSAGLPVGELQVLALSDQAVECLRAGQVSTVYELLEATEDELQRLPHFNRQILDEIGDRLVATGFVPSEGRETLFRTVAAEGVKEVDA